MASKLPKCTKYPRHKWRWVGNNTQGYLSKTFTHVTKQAFTNVIVGQQKKVNRNEPAYIKCANAANGRG